MKKRLRKKLHIKEFSEYGIEFEMTITASIEESAFNQLMERFIDDFVDGNKLVCGGSWNPEKKTAGFVIEVGQSIEAAKRYLPKLKIWFNDKDIVFEFTSSICDLWYPERKIT